MAATQFRTFKECLQFMEWLNDNKRSGARTQLAGRLARLLGKMYNGVGRNQIENALQQFLNGVSNFHKNLCKTAGHGTYKPQTAISTLNALVECIPKVLSVMYFLRYHVDKGFAAIGGGDWADKQIGMVELLATLGRPLDQIMHHATDIEKYLITPHGDEYGVIPGGFEPSELKPNNVRGYSVGSAMAADLGNLLDKNRYKENLFLDIYSTTVVGNRGTDTPNVANALRLVRDFCRIFEKVTDEQDFKSHLYSKDKCISLERLRAHCSELKKPLERIFTGQRFSFTGYARDFKDLNEKNIAKKMASWFKKNLREVRKKIGEIKSLSSITNIKKGSFRSGVIKPTDAKALAHYFTHNFFLYGFTFHGHDFNGWRNPYEVLTEDWDGVINVIKDKGKGLEELVNILNGKQCKFKEEKEKEKKDKDKEKNDRDREKKDGGEEPDPTDGDSENEDDEEAEPEDVESEDEPDEPLQDAENPPVKTESNKTEAAKPVVTKAEEKHTPTTKQEAGQNHGKKAEGAQNQGKKAEGAQNQGKKAEGAQNQGKKSEGEPRDSTVAQAVQTQDSSVQSPDAGSPGATGSSSGPVQGRQAGSSDVGQQTGQATQSGSGDRNTGSSAGIVDGSGGGGGGASKPKITCDNGKFIKVGNLTLCVSNTDLQRQDSVDKEWQRIQKEYDERMEKIRLEKEEVQKKQKAEELKQQQEEQERIMQLTDVEKRERQHSENWLREQDALWQQHPIVEATDAYYHHRNKYLHIPQHRPIGFSPIGEDEIPNIDGFNAIQPVPEDTWMYGGELYDIEGQEVADVKDVEQQEQNLVYHHDALLKIDAQNAQHERDIQALNQRSNKIVMEQEALKKAAEMDAIARNVAKTNLQRALLRVESFDISTHKIASNDHEPAPDLFIDIPQRLPADDLSIYNPYEELNANTSGNVKDDITDAGSWYGNDKGFSALPKSNFDLELTPPLFTPDGNGTGLSHDPSDGVSASGSDQQSGSGPAGSTSTSKASAPGVREAGRVGEGNENDRHQVKTMVITPPEKICVQPTLENLWKFSGKDGIQFCDPIIKPPHSTPVFNRRHPEEIWNEHIQKEEKKQKVAEEQYKAHGSTIILDGSQPTDDVDAHQEPWWYFDPAYSEINGKTIDNDLQEQLKNEKEAENLYWETKTKILNDHIDQRNRLRDRQKQDALEIEKYRIHEENKVNQVLQNIQKETQENESIATGLDGDMFMHLEGKEIKDLDDQLITKFDGDVVNNDSDVASHQIIANIENAHYELSEKQRRQNEADNNFLKNVSEYTSSVNQYGVENFDMIGAPSPKTTDYVDLQIEVPKRTLHDSIHDMDFDYDAPPLPKVEPLDPIGPSNPAINVNLAPPEALPDLPDNSAADYTHNPSTVGMCLSSWATSTPTPGSTDIPETELFPSQAPRTVRDMLQWLAGLRHPKHHSTLTECFNKAFNGLHKDTSQLAIPVNGSHIRPRDVFDILQLTAMFASSVLSAIAPNWKANVSFKNVKPKSSDEPDCCTLLCQLRDYVYACHHQLEFLKAQCGRDELYGGWKDCKYGSDITSSKSLLQSFLTDSWDSTFETHLFDPCNLCHKSRVRMGFRKDDLPKNHETGDALATILTPSCGGSDPLLTLSSYLNCLTRRTPRTTGELVSFFHHFGTSLHDAFDGRLLPLGESLSTSHADCPDWDHLKNSDLQAVSGIRGHESLNSISNHNHDKEHPRTLSTLVGCGSDPDSCHPRMSPITYRAYALYSQSFAHTYLGWTVYLPDRLWESLQKLHYDLLKHCGSGKCTSLHSCPYAMPLLYLHGFTPPEVGSQQQLTCSDVISKLQEIVNGQPIASLMTAMDNFLYGIREPFIFTLLALWSLAFLIFANTMLYRIDVLHIRSHLIRSKASHVIDVKALLTDGKKMMSLYDANYFDDDPNELLNLI